MLEDGRTASFDGARIAIIEPRNASARLTDGSRASAANGPAVSATVASNHR
jgi:hypothetical protein